jgi:hypothetical protein
MRARTSTPTTPPTLTLHLIERLVKAFKTHRAAIDFDAGFVNGFVPQLKKGIFQMNTNKVVSEL